VVTRAGRWTVSGSTFELEEHVVVTRVVADARLYATYRACTGYWDGKKCDRSQPRSVVGDCSLAGAAERIEEHDPPRTTRTATKPCAPPDPEGRECRDLGGVKYWHLGTDDPGSWVTEQEGIAYDATAHRWHRAAVP